MSNFYVIKWSIVLRLSVISTSSTILGLHRQKRINDRVWMEVLLPGHKKCWILMLNSIQPMNVQYLAIILPNTVTECVYSALFMKSNICARLFCSWQRNAHQMHWKSLPKIRQLTNLIGLEILWDIATLHQYKVDAIMISWCCFEVAGKEKNIIFICTKNVMCDFWNGCQ